MQLFDPSAWARPVAVQQLSIYHHSKYLAAQQFENIHVLSYSMHLTVKRINPSCSRPPQTSLSLYIYLTTTETLLANMTTATSAAGTSAADSTDECQRGQGAHERVAA